VVDAEEVALAENGYSLYAREVDGRVVLVAPRIIRQAEVDAIIEELP
jgi:hypothetical protein